MGDFMRWISGSGMGIIVQIGSNTPFRLSNASRSFLRDSVQTMSNTLYETLSTALHDDVLVGITQLEEEFQRTSRQTDKSDGQQLPDDDTFSLSAKLVIAGAEESLEFTLEAKSGYRARLHAPWAIHDEWSPYA